ncbi:MAG TPA: hypothetical protein PKA39_07020 [Ignavibacteria bacterium]|nr:hypothetical protein [Ignavibacteria bacterium]
MNLKPSRVIIFCKSVPVLLEFYSNIIGSSDSYIEADLKWGELKTGNMNIAFHYSPVKGKPAAGFKIVFYSSRVAAVRKKLMATGVKMGNIVSSGKLTLCNGRDPEGNIFQISNRK